MVVLWTKVLARPIGTKPHLVRHHNGTILNWYAKHRNVIICSPNYVDPEISPVNERNIAARDIGDGHHQRASARPVVRPEGSEERNRRNRNADCGEGPKLR